MRRAMSDDTAGVYDADTGAARSYYRGRRSIRDRHCKYREMRLTAQEQSPDKPDLQEVRSCEEYDRILRVGLRKVQRISCSTQ